MRCDATASTGLGHLSRCLALAEGLRDLGCTCEFVGHYETEFAAILSAAGFRFLPWQFPTGSAEDAQALIDHARAQDSDAMLVDDYRIAVMWLDDLAAAGVRLILFDDFAPLSSYRGCCGVLNFTVGAGRLEYSGLPDDRVLRGPDYFPARRELVRLRETRGVRFADRVDNVLVTLGGHDSHWSTGRVLDALSRVAPHVYARALASRATMQSPRAQLYCNRLVATTPSMAPHYGWADVCISGGGLTKYECAYLGLPVAVFSQTKAQQAETIDFAAEGLGYDVGGFEDLASLDERLRSFLTQSELRRWLVEASIARFRTDSTTRTAEAFLSWIS